MKHAAPDRGWGIGRRRRRRRVSTDASSQRLATTVELLCLEFEPVEPEEAVWHRIDAELNGPGRSGRRLEQ